MPKSTSVLKSSKHHSFGIEQPFDYDFEFCEGFVLGNLEDVSKSFAKDIKGLKPVSVHLQEKVPVRGSVYYLVQHRGENWVRIFVPFFHTFSSFHETLTALSKILKTKTIFWYLEDVSGSCGYNYHSDGKLVEFLAVLPDAPCVFKSRLPDRKSLKVKPGKEEEFINRFFEEQQVCVRLGFEWEISKGVSILKGPKLETAISVHLVDVPL